MTAGALLPRQLAIEDIVWNDDLDLLDHEDTGAERALLGLHFDPFAAAFRALLGRLLLLLRPLDE